MTPLRLVLEGRNRTAAAFVTNSSREAGLYRFSVENFVFDEYGKATSVEKPGRGQLFASPLLRISPRQAFIESGTSQRITVQARIPADLPPGEYLSFLFFQAMPAQEGPSVGAPQPVTTKPPAPAISSPPPRMAATPASTPTSMPATEPLRLASTAQPAAEWVRLLAGSTNTWTLRLAVVCSAGAIAKLDAVRPPGLEPFWLPTRMGDRACRAIYWGSYQSRGEALRASGSIPAAYRTPGDPPTPYRVERAVSAARPLLSTVQAPEVKATAPAAAEAAPPAGAAPAPPPRPGARPSGVGVKIGVSFRVGIPVVVRHGTTAVKVTLEDASFEPTAVGGKPGLLLRIRREGNRSAFLGGSIDLIQPGARPRQIGKVGLVSIYNPATTRNILVPLSVEKAADLAGAELAVSLTDAEKSDGVPLATARFRLP